MSLYNAYNLYIRAIYLNNVWLTVLLEIVYITYQYVARYAMNVINVLILCMNLFIEQVNVIIQCL